MMQILKHLGNSIQSSTLQSLFNDGPGITMSGLTKPLTLIELGKRCESTSLSSETVNPLANE